MSVEIINPVSKQAWLEARVQDITSTEVSALFGISPYMTLFELWHNKKNRIIESFEPSERMKWGTRLQDSIALGIAEDQGWSVRRMDEYMRDTYRMGASFDFECAPQGFQPRIVAPAQDEHTSPVFADTPRGLLEIKNVDYIQYKQGWVIDGDTIEAPPHIELQVQHQLAVSGRAFAYLGALISGNRVVLIKRLPDVAIIEAIRGKVLDFWQSIEKNNPPSPDFSADSDLISRLYGYAEPGKVFDARNDNEIATLCMRYKQVKEAIKEADKEAESLKAQVLTKIGDSEKVLGDGFTITAGMVSECPMNYVRKAYRNFRINVSKKEK